jgi:hypothetical protein
MSIMMAIMKHLKLNQFTFTVYVFAEPYAESKARPRTSLEIRLFALLFSILSRI